MDRLLRTVAPDDFDTTVWAHGDVEARMRRRCDLIAAKASANGGSLPKSSDQTSDDFKDQVWLNKMANNVLLPTWKRAILDATLPGWDYVRANAGVRGWATKWARVRTWLSSNTDSRPNLSAADREESWVAHFLFDVRKVLPLDDPRRIEMVAVLGPDWDHKFGFWPVED